MYKNIRKGVLNENEILIKERELITLTNNFVIKRSAMKKNMTKNLLYIPY